MDLAIDQSRIGDRQVLTLDLAGLGMKPVRNLFTQQKLLQRRRWGRIVTSHGRLLGVFGRWWPYTGNMLQVLLDSQIRVLPSDYCELYYHAPLTAPGFLTLSYTRSGPGTSVGTLYAAGLVLDEIARIRRSNAIVTHVSNSRISEHALERWGWQRHCLSWKGRHFVKRFYGSYPAIPNHWLPRVTGETDSTALAGETVLHADFPISIAAGSNDIRKDHDGIAVRRMTEVAMNVE